MSQQALPPPNSARVAITSFCAVLSQHGITSLEPELVRQAKFDGPASAPLWQVLHDTVLVVLAGCPSGPICQAALSRQWAQVALELPGEEEFPHEGASLVLRQLAVWGAPPDLLRELAPRPAGSPDPDLHQDLDPGSNPDRRSRGGGGPSSWPRCRSRPLLLALGWLAAAAGLFERRIGELEPGPTLQALLPPYPPDACVSPAVQASYDSAARDAQEHVRKLPAGVSSDTAVSPAAAAASGRAAAGVRGNGRTGNGGQDPFGPGASAAAAEALWADVEAAAQRAVMLCGRVRSRLVALQAATDCRNRLAHSLWSRQAAAAPSVRPLTPYELQLCAQPAAMQRHMTALETATLALLEQQELAAHGALFFEWLGSVLEEEQQHQQQLQHPHAGGSGRRGAVGAPYRAHGAQVGNRAGTGSGGGGALSSLEHLPYATSDAGTRLASQLEAQLAAAEQAAEPELSAARRRTADLQRQAGGGEGGGGGGGPGGPSSAPPGRPPGQQQPQQALTIDHFLALAEKAISEEWFAELDNWYDEGVGGGSTGGAAGAGGGSGLPLLGVGGTAAGAGNDAGAWRLPDDLAEALNAVQAAERSRRCAEEEEAVRFEQLRYAALARYDFSSGAAAGPLSGPPPPPAQSGNAAVSATSETQRLLAVVLAAARPLARTRAAHKAALLAALKDLPEGCIVAGL